MTTPRPQPDSPPPDVAKLQARIAELEAELDEAQMFVPCNVCNGTGMVEVYPPYPDGRDEASCSMCLGDGVKPHKAFDTARRAAAARLRAVKRMRKCAEIYRDYEAYP